VNSKGNVKCKRLARWNSLPFKQKFKPKDIITKVKMHQRLKVSMKRGSDLAVLFETLTAIKDQYDGIGAIKEVDLIAIVLDVATEEYQAALTAEQSSNGYDSTLLSN
jgi:hypothetical protein